MNTLSPVFPLSRIRPRSLVLLPVKPEPSSISASSIVVFVVLIVDDEPATVRLPLTLTFALSSVIVFVPDPESNPSPAFMVKLALKDLGIAVDLGKKVNTDLDLGRASIETYQSAIKEGREEQDWTSIFLSLQNRAGLSLPDNIKK